MRKWFYPSRHCKYPWLPSSSLGRSSLFLCLSVCFQRVEEGGFISLLFFAVSSFVRHKTTSSSFFSCHSNWRGEEMAQDQTFLRFHICPRWWVFIKVYLVKQFWSLWYMARVLTKSALFISKVNFSYHKSVSISSREMFLCFNSPQINRHVSFQNETLDLDFATERKDGE